MTIFASSTTVFEFAVIGADLPLVVLDDLRPCAMDASCFQLLSAFFALLWESEAHHLKEVRCVLVSASATPVIALDDFHDGQSVSAFITSHHCMLDVKRSRPILNILELCDLVAEIADEIDLVIILASHVLLADLHSRFILLIYVRSLFVQAQFLAYGVAFFVSGRTVESQNTFHSQIGPLTEQLCIGAVNSWVTKQVARSLQIGDHEQVLTLNMGEVTE